MLPKARCAECRRKNRRRPGTWYTVLIVLARIQGGEPLTLGLCRQVISDSDSTANAGRVYRLVQQWRAQIDDTRRLSRR
jgi:hypothetical protein